MNAENPYFAVFEAIDRLNDFGSDSELTKFCDQVVSWLYVRYADGDISESQHALFMKMLCEEESRVRQYLIKQSSFAVDSKFSNAESLLRDMSLG